MGTLLTRRNFLIASAATVAGASALSWPRPHKASALGKIIGGGQGLQDGNLIHYLSLVNLDETQPSPLFFPLKFLAHGVSVHPHKPHLLALFEKKGPSACEIDLKAGHWTRTITTAPERYFYGHGTYSTDGAYLYSTETVLASSEGVIVIRDSATLKEIGLFPSYGSNPHDCQLIENGTVLAITNGGGKTGSAPSPCVSYVEIASQKLLQKYEMRDPRFNTGHLIISKNKDLAVASAPRLGLPEDGPGAISLLVKDGVLKNLNTSEINANLKSETLSLCIDEDRGVLAATSPVGNLVTFWSIKTGNLISSLELTSPRGIVLTADRRHYAVSNGADAGLSLVNSRTLQLDHPSRIERAGYSGSHLYLLS